MTERKTISLKQQDEQSSRQRILRAALGVFAESGFDGASLREIARRAKVHQPAIAYHFDNKEMLWKSAARAITDKQLRFLNETIEQIQDGDRRLAEVSYLFVRFVAEHPEWSMFIVGTAGQSNDRSRWLADSCLKPVAERLFRCVTNRHWPESASEQIWAVSLTALISGASIVFAKRSLIAEMSAVDIHSEAFIREYAHSLSAALKGLIAAHHASPKQ